MNLRKKMPMNSPELLESNLNRGGMNFNFCPARIAEAAKMETKGHFLLAWLPDSLNVSDASEVCSRRKSIHHARGVTSER